MSLHRHAAKRDQNEPAIVTTLTPRQRAALERVAWGTEHFGALVTGRSTRADVVRRLHAKGLVKDAGMVAVCDGDGFLLSPQRYRQGWSIADAGKEVLK